MSSTIQGYSNSGYVSGVDSTGSADGTNTQSELEQFLELLIEELQQLLSQSQSSNDDSTGGGGGVGGTGSSSPSYASTPSTTGTTTPSPGSDTSGAGNTGTTGSSSSTVPDVSDSDDAASAIAQDLKSRYGLNDAQVAGVLGNLEQESGLQSNVNQGGATGEPTSNYADDNNNGYGLAQWGGSRKQGEIEYAEKNGLEPGSLQANMGYMNQELDTDYSKTISDLKSTSTPEQAAQVWDTDYEQASDPQMQNRDQYAEQFYSEGL
ncbi:hypothetical protein CIC12_21870 [Burkholderia sp. SG-MS1]|uniref:phage tail tip lysozyme n=1 Tax=Paraburkholderia sp. SG-MS1 TaxID=2023741 RepID=UPI001447A38A|nr:phage tail tip lysozyme [Paraburkholderia sp. SG-MS1]NKJ49329.1 hypothetical protein [Paraburkholderia sp. SG-MS1]